jgi:hypothetical protein
MGRQNEREEEEEEEEERKKQMKISRVGITEQARLQQEIDNEERRWQLDREERKKPIIEEEEASQGDKRTK